jgi:hypothetical protein
MMIRGLLSVTLIKTPLNIFNKAPSSPEVRETALANSFIDED